MRMLCAAGVALCLVAAAGARAATCSSDMLASVIDETGAALRNLNIRSEREFRARLDTLAKSNGWSDAVKAERAQAAATDPRVTSYSAQVEALLGQVDGMSRPAGASVDCAQVNAIKSVRDEMLTVMGQKSGAMLASLEAVRPAAEPQRERSPADAPRERSPAEPQRERASPAPRADRPPVASPVPPAPEQRPAEPDVAALRPPEPSLPPIDIAPLPPPTDPTFSIDEVREAGRGLFGTISAEFAGAINYAFQSFGRPTGYIIGSEGGGAFLAGLRYGQGDLHQKTGSVRPVFWQGPSLGYDVGAEGSRTMFLVYGLNDWEELFARFSGVGGAAYVAGGVGITVLSNGSITLVPIKTGLGLRLGANLSYLKFTSKPTWNPF